MQIRWLSLSTSPALTTTSPWKTPHRRSQRCCTSHSPPCHFHGTGVSLRALQLSVCFSPALRLSPNGDLHLETHSGIATPAVDTTALRHSVHSPLAEAPASLPALAACSLEVHPNSEPSVQTLPPPEKKLPAHWGQSSLNSQFQTSNAQSACPSQLTAAPMCSTRSPSYQPWV